MYKLAPEEGSAFFIRREYLTNLDFDALQPGFELNEEEREELLDAGLSCVVELKAVDYLARAEQCRAGLKRKLLQKGYAAQYIDRALSFLESADYLSDERFARAWLNTRRINHFEGRTRLLAELMSRGINRDISSAAIEYFFTENDEDEICCKAYEKLSKKKSGDKLVTAMMQAGFSYKQISAAVERLSGQAGQ